jgi:hypothetical protein
VVQRALSRVGERLYSLTANNCEHLATWCATEMRAWDAAEGARFTDRLLAVIAQVKPGAGTAVPPVRGSLQQDR